MVPIFIYVAFGQILFIYAPVCEIMDLNNGNRKNKNKAISLVWL